MKAIVRSTLALMTRALRQDSRLLLAHLLRFFPAAIVLWFLWITHDTWRYVGAPGRMFFGQIAFLNCFLITLAGISFFATAITEEKEQRTLGLLRMADVGAVSMLLGKSTPRMLAAALLLIVQVPFTLLAITLGGVLLRQVVAAYLTLLAQTVFLANLALVCSVVSRRSSAANRMMVICCLVLYLIPEFVLISPPPATPGWLLDSLGAIRETSAFYRLREVLATSFSGSPVGTQVIANVAGGAALFLVAWGLFGRFAHDEEGQTTPRFNWLTTPWQRERPFGRRRAWSNALVWKDFYYLSGGRSLLAVKFALYGALLVGLVMYFSQFGYWSRNSLEHTGQTIMSVMILAIVIEVAVVASRIFLHEVRERTLSTLLMLPHATGAIAWSKVAGCLTGLVPAVTWFLLGAMLAPDDFGDVLEEVIEEPGAWFMIAQAVLFAHLVALLSMFVSWGALPLTLGGFAFLYACCAFSLESAGGGPGGEDALFFMLAVGSWLAVVGVQVLIAERLRNLAARQ